jgi:hypothetical protein
MRLKYLLKWVLEILTPYLALVVGLVFLRISRRQHRFGSDEELKYQDKLETAYDIGYDSCILGVGIAIVFVGGSELQATLETELAILLPLLIGGVTIVILLLIGTSKYSNYAKAVVGVITGSVIFGANSAIRSWLNEHNLARMIKVGIAACIASTLLFLIIIYWLRRNHANEKAKHQQEIAKAMVEKLPS